MSLRLLTGDPLGWEVDRPTVVTVGVFDGVHLGHQKVMAKVVERAGALDARPAALTFDPHPLEFLAPDRAPRMLTSVDQRAELLSELGIELVGVLPFLQIRDLPPQAFGIEVLAERLQARWVAVGADFRFGRDRSGDPELLARVGQDHGFEVEVMGMLGEKDGEVVSSTRIRRYLAEGRVADAARLLGRPFELRGTVIHGDARGTGIGFPTANLHIPERMAIPADGVYAVRAATGDDVHPAVVNIGVRPTFGVSTRTVEAHLLDFSGDLYGTEMGLRFVARLRDERRFDSVDELVAQLHRDVAAGRELLGASA